VAKIRRTLSCNFPPWAGSGHRPSGCGWPVRFAVAVVDNYLLPHVGGEPLYRLFKVGFTGPIKECEPSAKADCRNGDQLVVTAYSIRTHLSLFQVQGPSNEFRYQGEMYPYQSRCYTEKQVLDVCNRLATEGELDIPVRG
jgi:hypothetical protein